MTNGHTQVPRPINEPVLSYAPQTPERKTLKQELTRQLATQVEIPAVIGGKHIFNKTRAKDVVVPHQHRHVLAKAYQVTAEETQAAIAASAVGRKAWAALPWEERAAVFLKAADLMTGKYRAATNAATMLGQSKTAHQSEIDAVCELADFYRFNVHFMQKIYQEQPSSPAGQWNRSEARGLEGFVYAITPFNFTSIALNLPTAPALMGCSVIWKPAHTSLLGAWLGYQILEEAGLPPGVINFIPGEAPMISEALLNHRDLAGIHFTGSTPTFNMLWSTVGKNINSYAQYPRLVGETGGKDFVFAHPSADPEQLVTALVRGAFEYQGQKCSAASRAYIPKSLWGKVKGPLCDITASLKMGDPNDFSNFMAAVIDERSFDRIEKHIAAAKHSSKAKIIAGGECDKSQGYFIRPTIIQVEDPKFPSFCEEIFGPVLSIFVYDDQDLEATLDLCDKGTPYALTGAIFARDRQVIHHLTRRLEHAAGNFYVNDKPTGAVVGQQPFGGGRASGTNDKAGSMWNLLRWTSFRTIKENFLPITDYRYSFMSEP